MSPTSPRLPLPATNTAPPFKVHRGSRLIHKQPPAAASSSSSSNSSTSSASGLTTTTKNKNNAATAAAAHRPPSRQQHKQPVIIYTHSPKVIRTSPRDFMSIVQRLTGLDSARTAASHSHHDSSSSSSSADSCTNTSHHHAHAPPPPSSHSHSYVVVDPPPPPLPTTHHFIPPEIPLLARAPASDLPPALCAYAAPFVPVMSSPAATATATVFSAPDVPFPDH
ncbi:protein MKS1-like [Oryza glaberrima]|uniref:VQ domain-containing protein n=2 Tax=Oryza TaxID=4527 RepID=A0A0D3HGW8_9ORYZ|nr:protein MKS1-like [Oryza glaberrima]